MQYTPLYIKTDSSLLSSMIMIDNLIEFAKKNNLKTLTITDDNMYGVIDFYQKCKKNNIKPIIGLEVIIDDFKFILYATNYLGYKNLLKINTLVIENNLSISNFLDYASNLICIVPFSSVKIYDDLKEFFSYIYIGYQDKEEREQLQGNNLIYLNRVLYLYESEKYFLKYLIAIKEGVSFKQVISDKNDYSLETNIKLAESFSEDLNNNYFIENLCNIELQFNQELLPEFLCPNDMDSYEYLKKLCLEGLKRIFGGKVFEIYIERLKYELKVIKQMEFCNYFLIVWDYVKYAKEHGILVGPGRGSAAGSLVSYCLNITDVDPIKYNLLFERFLNPERITMPDIDIDFEDNRREEVINYCINKYGIKKVAPIITFGTLGAKQVVRDVARVMEIDLTIVDSLSKMLDTNLSLKENYQKSVKLRNYISNNQELVNLYKIATNFEGLKRHTSVHAAGIVMARIDLDEIIPLDNKHEDFYTTAYSMEYLEEIGLLKMDFLGLRGLSTITDVINNINKFEQANLSFSEIPLHDKKAINIFTNVLTTGIFQFESTGMINFLKKFKPTNLEDLFAAIALFRPGPMNNIDSYIKRKHGKEKIEYLHPDLEKILKPTYGIIVYQEQIIQIANLMAGYSLGEADVLRRAMSKKSESTLLNEKEKFISRCIDKGYEQELSVKVFDLILKFASYGFNRAHSVAYSLIAYKMAYLKAHYPKYFMKSLLSMVTGSDIKTKEYIHECRLYNIKILKPDINYSDKNYLVVDNGIRFPLSVIRNVGVNSISTITMEREKGKYKDIFDFIKRVYGKSVNKKTLESLVYSGCLDSFGINRKTLYENLDLLINYGDLIKGLDENDALKPELVYHEEYPNKELLKLELEVFGFYLSRHPITEIKLKYKEIVNLNEIEKYFDKNINIIVYIDRIKEIDTKSNKKMAFIKASDEINSIDITVFPEAYERINIEPGNIVKVFGKVEKRFDKLQIVVNNIEVIE